MQKNIITNHLTNIGCLKNDNLAMDVLKSSIVDRLYSTNHYLDKVIKNYCNNPQYLQYMQNQKHDIKTKSIIYDLIKITTDLQPNTQV